VKFLVINGSEEMVRVVSLCLALGWPDAEILGATDGERGLQLARDRAPDLVILDVVLPHMNGLRVLQLLREFSDTPVLVLSSRDDQVEIAHFSAQGADDYMVKPFSHVALIGRVRAIFRQAGGQECRAPRPQHPEGRGGAPGSEERR